MILSLLKNVIWFVVIIVLGYGAYTFLSRPKPCEEPIPYSLGSFDQRFGISRENFLKNIEEAEIIWEKVIGKELFVYEEGADVKVNLIYDVRQETSVLNRTLEGKVNETVQSAESVKDEFEALKVVHSQKSVEYANLLSQLKQMQSKYNTNVEYWNKRGGAPRNEYEKIQDEKEALVSFQNTVEAKRVELNFMSDKINNLVKKYNELVGIANSNIRTINQSADKEFEEGEYVSDAEGQRINIYEFSDKTALVRVLAHELGHVLTLDHNENPQSIMYYLNNSKNLKLTEEDIRDLQAICSLVE